MKEYSQKIAESIASNLSNHGLKYQFNEEKGLFSFRISGSGKAKNLMYRIHVFDHAFIVHAQYPLGPDPENFEEMDNMMRFLTRVNFGLWGGNFELDLDDGEICFKVFHSCTNEEVSDSMISNSILCPSTMFDVYGLGIMDILFNDASDLEAIENCQNHLDGLLEGLDA